MRLDKFLKVSRIIKRRSVASEACSSSHVAVTFGDRVLKFEVLVLSEHMPKDKTGEMYRILS